MSRVGVAVTAAPANGTAPAATAAHTAAVIMLLFISDALHFGLAFISLLDIFIIADAYKTVNECAHNKNKLCVLTIVFAYFIRYIEQITGCG